jgi:hypothetical protein
MKKEIFEQVLKRRIFYSDLYEKVEKFLQKHLLIPKDGSYLYCDDTTLRIFKSCLTTEDNHLLKKLYEEIRPRSET